MKRLLIILLALVVSGCSTHLDVLDDMAYAGMQFDRSHTAGQKIRIDFSTAQNFQEEVIRDGHLVSMQPAFCRQIKHGFKYFWFDKVWRLDGQFIELEERVPEPPKSLYTYSFFIPEKIVHRGEEHAESHGLFLQSYDLRERPEDICVRFEMTHGMGFRKPSYSKIVRIPKEEFIKLFASHPQ